MKTYEKSGCKHDDVLAYILILFMTILLCRHTSCSHVSVARLSLCRVWLSVCLPVFCAVMIFVIVCVLLFRHSFVCRLDPCR